jgi:cytochrome oxidase Cu insertion factor (SCO1/SenC/PrrC family)
MLKRARGDLLLLVFVCVLGSVPTSDPASAQTRQTLQEKAGRYVCPMHPDVTAAKPGRCPTCGMALRLVGDTVEETPPVSPMLMPDIRVRDHNGKRLMFYTDLVKHRTVAINFIFTTCTTICPSLTATFRRVQQELSKRAPDVQLVSISVDPTTDTPERLRDFAAKFEAGPGWTFVTGEKADIESLLRALGAAVANANDHTPMILINNDEAGYRTRTYGLSSPAELVKVIEEVASRK